MLQTEYLLDTNIVSESRKKKPDEGVDRFFQTVPPSSLYLSVLSLGELRKGIAMKLKSDPVAASALGTWAEQVEFAFSNRLLGIDKEIARIWGELCAQRPRVTVDTLLAATAIRHGLTLVTRNVSDVADIPVTVLNPFKNDPKT